MSDDVTTPSQWDESEYTPFPSFTDWAPDSFDSELVDRYETQLRALRGRVSEADLDRALEVVNRYAAIDTGAIEGLYQVDRGFTKTVATQTAAWENALKLKGEGVARAIDDALGAYEYVLDAVTEAVPVTEVWIRELHQIICASQGTFTVHTPVGPQAQALPKGRYKEMPNSPTNVSTGRVHAYAPPSQTPAEMARFISELRSDAFRAAHPVVQAAYAHYAYVAIHPFSDGNGRVARALASVYLYRSPGVPLVVFADQRDRYLDALEAADGGDARPFVRFIESRTADAVALLEASLLNVTTLATSADLETLETIFGGDGSEEALLDAADKVKSLAMDALDVAVRGANLPGRIAVTIGRTSLTNRQKSNGWRSVGSRERFVIRASSEVPIAVSVSDSYEVLLRSEGVGSEFAIRADGEEPDVDVWLRDVTPTETEAVRLKLEFWAERAVRRFIHKISTAAKTN